MGDVDMIAGEGLDPEQQVVYAIGLAGMKMVQIRSFLNDDGDDLTSGQKRCIEQLASEASKTALELAAKRRLLAGQRGFSNVDQAKDSVDLVFDAVKDDLHFRRTASDNIIERILHPAPEKWAADDDVLDHYTSQQDERVDLAMRFREWALAFESVPHRY